MSLGEHVPDNGVDKEVNRPMSAGEALEHLHGDIIFAIDLIKWNGKLIAGVGVFIALLSAIALVLSLT